MTEKPKRRNPAARKLEDVKQKLYQAQASGDRFQQMVWKAVLEKLMNEKK
jgi:hypothetical protein